MTEDDEIPQPRQRLRLALWAFGVFLLLIPAVAMQMTHAVNWGSEDFLTAALLIGGAGLGIEVAVRTLRNPARRWLAIAVVLGVVLLIWAELAVGIFD